MDIHYLVRAGIIVFTFFLPVAIGSYRYHKLDKGTKYFYYLAIFLFLSESYAHYRALHHEKNIVSYNISIITELLLVSVYLNFSFDAFRKKNIGLIIGVASTILGIINIVFIQSPYEIATYFLFFQALVTIVLSMTALSFFLDINYFFHGFDLLNEVDLFCPS